MIPVNTINYHDSDIERLLTAFAGDKEPDRVPYFEYFTINNDVYAAVLGKQPSVQGPSFDEKMELALRLGMDALSVGRIAWVPGKHYSMVSAGVGRYAGGSIKGRADFDPHTAPRPSIETWLPELEENLATLSPTKLGGFAYVTHFFPATHVSMGLEDFCYALTDDRQFIEEFMDLNLEFLLAGVREAVKRPIRFLFIDCDCAYKNGLMINPKLFRELWYDRTRRLIEPALAKGIPVTFHSDGKMDELIPMLIDLGFSAIHPIEPAANDIYKVKRRFGKDICIMGNIDVAGVLAFGSPDEVRQDVRTHIDRLGPGGHYVLGSSSHPFQGIPAENVLAMVREVHGE